MTKVKVTVLNNGPLLVNGEVDLVDQDGNAIEVAKQPFALCRCGASAIKPFCDGSHSKICFDAVTRKSV
jgi:CDGSH-type Zn-finger protein